jgi:hypothetical protein
MRDIVPKFVDVDGYVFIDRFAETRPIEVEVRKYSSAKEAQTWINIVLIEDFVTEVVGDEWDYADPEIGNLLSIYEEAWRLQLQSLYPGTSFEIERLIDDENGDLGVILRQGEPLYIPGPGPDRRRMTT